jgi:hypothetical protein
MNDFQKTIELDPYHFLGRASMCDILRKTGFDSEADEHEKVARDVLMQENEYNRACFESIIGNVDLALKLLDAALRNKQGTKEWARNDPDFSNVQDDPLFKKLVGE